MEKTTIICQDQESLKILRHELNEQRKEGKYCDFTLETEDGGSFKVHRNILEPASKFFKKLFNSKFRDSNADCLTLVRVSSAVLARVIEFIYMGKVEIPNDSARETLDIALFLLLDVMVDSCTQILMKSVNLENCFDLLAYSETYHRAEMLREKCAGLILSNLATIMNSPALVQISSDSMNMLVSHDRNECIEEQLYLAAVKWIIYDIKKREQFIQTFMDRIKLEKITYEFVLSNVLENNRLLENTEFQLKLAGLVSKCWKQKVKINKGQNPTLNVQSKNLYAVIGTEMLSFNWQTKDFPEVVKKMIDSRTHYGYSTFNGNNFFVCGGWRNSTSINTCKYFSIEDKSWKSLPSMKIARDGHRAITLDDKIYVCGGDYEKSVEIFDLNKKVWSVGPSLDNEMDTFGLCSFENCIYAVDEHDFQRLDSREDSWTTLPSYEYGNYRSYSAVAYNNSIFAICDEGIASFDVRNNKWLEDFESFPIKYNCDENEAFLSDDEIYILARIQTSEERDEYAYLMQSYNASDLSYRFSSLTQVENIDDSCHAFFSI